MAGTLPGQCVRSQAFLLNTEGTEDPEMKFVCRFRLRQLVGAEKNILSADI